MHVSSRKRCTAISLIQVADMHEQLRYICKSLENHAQNVHAYVKRKVQSIISIDNTLTL